MAEEKTVGKIIESFLQGGGHTMNKKRITQRDTIDAAKLKELDISTSEAFVTVTTHEDMRIDLVLETYEEGPELTTNYSGDSIIISAQKPETHKPFKQRVPRCRLYIMVPKNIADSWRVATSSGDVSAKKLLCDSFDIRSSSGELILVNLHAQSANLNNSSGKITAIDMTGNEVYFKTSSGNVEFAGIQGELSGSTSSGDIIVKNLQGEKFNVTTSSGKIQQSNIVVKEVAVKTISGGIQVNYLKAEWVLFDSNSGSISCTDFAGDTKAHTMSGDVVISVIEECALDIETTSGDITLLSEQINLNATVEINIGSGDIETNLQMSVNENSKNGIKGVIGDGKNLIWLKASSGDIRVS